MCKVVLLAYTQLNPNAILPEELSRWDSTEQEALIEYAARVCYRSMPKMGSNPSFIRQRMKEGHEDIIEHISATFLFDGCSRSCTHQLVRHRLASYSQESQRYVDLDKGGDLSEDPSPEELYNFFVIPPALRPFDPNNETLMAFLANLKKAVEGYRAARAAGLKKEDARFLLPNATPTRIVVSMNLRSWRHFVALRAHPAAQWEIRAIAKEVLKELYQLAPSVFEDQVEAFGLSVRD
jgi:thymidylate synthase (FAD)